MPPTTKAARDDAAMQIVRAQLADKVRFTQENPRKVYTIVNAAAVVRAQLEILFPQPKKTARVNGRDLLFDAIVTGCGCDLTSMTRNFSKQVATAKRDILEATPDVTPEEVLRRIKAYRAKYREAACTPMALANHWPEFGLPAEARTRGSKSDIYTEPSLPWRPLAQKLYPQAREWITPHDFESMKWAEVNSDLRRAILAKLYP